LNRKIDLIYIDSGGGHRAAASALATVIREQQRPWDLRLLSIQDLLDPIDFIRHATGVPFQDVYNILLRRGWTLGMDLLVPLAHLLIRMTHRKQVKALAQHWAKQRPDLVVSVIPHYNRALKQALERCWPGTPFVTILTDIADYPPHFWIERQDQFVICGSARAAAQARAQGIPDSQILRASGMILNPKFYAPLELDRRAERRRAGLQPELPTGLVLFGGEGSSKMLEIARRLNRADSGIQLILICGKNQAIARQLRALHPQIPMLVEGFTQDLPYYMALADFFIGKPGPASLGEALAMRLPVIVERNAWTMPQERYNTDWIQEQQVGLVLNSFCRIFEAVRTLLVPEAYERFRRRARETRNHAVYEVVQMLDDILERKPSPLPVQSSAEELTANR
jgi:UDP-N-acetylglucosamine:LPS N-acetylglucosamine transferase